MKEISGGKYMRLALLAVAGFCLEFVLAFIVEPFIFGVSLNDYSTPQFIAHWTITCIVWGLVVWWIIATAKNKYEFNILKKGNRMVWWQWLIVVICIAASVSVSYHNWGGFKVIKEFTNLGVLKFVFQYIYYLFETMLVTLVLVFSQKAFEKWFHKDSAVWIPYGGVLTGLTWGMVHILTKGDLSTGVSLSLISIGYGITYLLVNRDIKKAYIWILLMFVL